MATTVTIGGADATDVTVASATSLTCTVPAGTGGETVDVVVSTSTDTATLTDGYTYEAVEPPTITALDPGTGEEVGTINNTLTGTGLTQVGPATAYPYGLRFVQGTSFSRTMGALSGVSGSGGTSGTLTVTSMPPGTFDLQLFEKVPGTNDVATIIDTITDALVVTEMTNPPVLTSIDPTSGPIGTAVVLTGTSLPTSSTWSAGLVDDDGDLRRASSVVRGTTQWTGSVGSGDYTDSVAYDVVMWWSYSTENYVKATLPAAFTVVEVVQAITPAAVPPGTPVELTATGEDLGLYTDWHLRLDADEGHVGGPRGDVAVTGFVVLSETNVQFTATLPVQGAYHVVAIDADGNTVVLGFDKVIADSSAQVPE